MSAPVDEERVEGATPKRSAVREFRDSEMAEWSPKGKEYRFLKNGLERILLDVLGGIEDLRPASDALVEIAAAWNRRNRREETSRRR